MSARPPLTGRWNPRALEAVKQSHRQDAASAVVLEAASGPELLPLVLRDPVVTFAEDWAPYVQITADGVAPDSADELARIDPRKTVLVEVQAGYVYDDGVVDVQRLALGHLRSRRAILPDGNMPLTAAGAEQLAVDARWLLPTTTKSFTGVLEAITYLLEYAHGHAVESWQTTINPGHRADLTNAVTLEQGTEIWTVAHGLALSAGLRLWADENGVWNLAPKATLAGLTAAMLKQGPATTVSRVEDVLTREGWYNAAILKYTWKDAAGEDVEVVGTFAPRPPEGFQAGAGCRTYTSDRPGPITQHQANLNAEATVANLSTRGDSYVVESVAMYWLRPGMTVQVDLANGTSARHIVRRVVFQVSAGTMTVTTREPNNLEEN